MNELKPLVKKVLESGLVDKNMAELMEKWGNLPEGAASLVKDDSLKNATKDQLMKLAEEIGTEVDKERTLKETQLDLDQIRWPTVVTIRTNNYEHVAWQVPAVIDRMGRLYFRIQDAKEEWFVPGYNIHRKGVSPQNGYESPIYEVVTEKSVLYVGELPVCIQVTVVPSERTV
jgi:hypothetical protein